LKPFFLSISLFWSFEHFLYHRLFISYCKFICIIIAIMCYHLYLIHPHSQSGGYTGIPLSVRPSVRPSLNLVYVLLHFIHIWYPGWPWSEHAHIIPISRMVDFCESNSVIALFMFPYELLL
jgi:hypothetical protein